MRRTRIAILVGALAWAPPVAAQDLAPTPRAVDAAGPATWEIAGATSYLSAPIRGGTSPFGAGFGGRIGTSFGPLYVGANVVDYLGGTDHDLQVRSLLWGGEAGYTLRRRFNGGPELIVRPGVGAGAAMMFYTVPTSTVTTSTANVASHAAVDIVSTASSRTTTTVTSTTTGSTGTTATTDTSTTTSLYIQPSLTVMLASSWSFVAVKASAVVMPVVPDGAGGDATWLTYGLEAEVGLRF